MKSQLSLACLYVVVILFSFFAVKLLKHLKMINICNYIFITQNIYRENVARSVDSDTVLTAVDILFNIGDKTFADIKAENA